MNGFQNVVSDAKRSGGPQRIRSDDTSDATHPTSPLTRRYLGRTKSTTRGKYVGEANAAVILEVAKAIEAYLELSDLLGALIVTLKPILEFGAVGIVVRDGEYAKLHSFRNAGAPEHHDSVQSLLERYGSDLDIEPIRTRIPINDHHFSVVMSSREPYVCADVETKRRFLTDDSFLKCGIRSYVALPLTKQGELIGVVDFFSLKCRSFTTEEITLLRDVSHLLSIPVSNAMAYEQTNVLNKQLQIENLLLQDEIVEKSIYEEIVGSSTSLRKVLAAIDEVARTDSTVLVTGETGTGKELVAHAIHRRSPRSARALVKVNCAAFPSELIASELFGHEKGAFTGALQQRIGRFEAANGGTIFLDQIEELTTEMQIALLRVVQEKEFERVGGNRTLRTDVRVIAATNRDLHREVCNGRFRMDLYYRLNVFPVHMPALRDRPGDIPILVDYFAARLAGRMGKRIRHIEKRTLDAMQQYSWPGNIRELQNIIERGIILAEGEVFRLEPGALQSGAS